jgi:predicted amidohydrolase YtcJ
MPTFVKQRVFLLIFLALFSSEAPAQALSPEMIRYADLILHNGKIVTVDEHFTIAQAIAVRKGKFLAVGKDKEILRLAGPKTVKIDLKDKTVLPGLIDTHNHPLDHSLKKYALRSVPELNENVVSGSSFKEFLDGIKAVAEKANPDEWVIARLDSNDIAYDFWRNHSYRDLDKVASGRLVLVLQGTRGLTTSKGLEALRKRYGFDSELLRLPGLVDKHGKPSGRFRQEVVRLIQTDLIMQGEREILRDAYYKALLDLAKYGITTWSSSVQPLQALEVLTELDLDGKLPVRFGYTHALGFASLPNPAGVYERLGVNQGQGSDFLWLIGASPATIDGSYPNLCTSVKAREAIKKREECLAKPGDFKRVGIETIVRSGNRITGLHVAGDLALDHLMDAIEKASKEAGLKPSEIQAKRHAVDHCLMNPRRDQYERIKRLGIIVSCAPVYIELSAPRILRDYGEEYLKWNLPVKSLTEAGVKTVMELDTELKPSKNAFYYIQLLLTRETGGKAWNLSEKIDRVTALKMFTRWAAEYVLRENVIGSIEPGKWADLIVLDRDYMTVPESHIGKIQVVLTLIGGRIVYQDSVITVAERFGRRLLDIVRSVVRATAKPED